MFTQANSLVAIVGDVVLVSLLLSVAALVATVVTDWCAPPSAQSCAGVANDVWIFGASAPSLGAERTGARDSRQALTLIRGGRQAGQDQGPPRGQLSLVPSRQRGATATAAASGAAVGASAAGIFAKLARR